jgi:DEAD/DEAH box helicase domain-containing protein
MIRGDAPDPPEHLCSGRYPPVPSIPEAEFADPGGGEEQDRIDRFAREVIAAPDRAGQVQLVLRVPPRPARYEDDGALDLDPRWRAYLKNRGIERLYSHQAKAIGIAREGRNVVVVTSTASGKTLCYNIPVLDLFLRSSRAGGAEADTAGDPSSGSYALYLFPTKALAQDQMRVLDEMIRGLGLEVEAGVFDGDTEPDRRKRLRRRGRIILTNPDMLHQSILPHHGGWAGLFRGLRLVVVDEIHSLRGIFGSNVANVIRRLKRIAAHYGARPRFIAASATIRNPAEHAERLLGEPVEVVDEDGSPRGEKVFVLWNPPVVERPDGSVYRRGATSTAVDLLPELLRREVRTICFAQARSTVELVLRYTWDRLRGDRSLAPLASKLESYRAGYLPGERRQIEKRLFSGDLLGVVSTNALELGIDVGGLEACLLVGYPGTIASFHQRAGRAGRRSRRSLVIFIARPDPIDQYFMRHPEEVFEKSPESAIAEPDNPYILTKHLICAAYELPLTPKDAPLFGGESLFPGVVGLLAEGGRLREAEGKWYLADSDFPAKKVKLRTVSDENFTIFEVGSKKIVGELDYVAGLLSLYEGAIYMHRSETHFVEELDVVNRIARIRRDESGYYTQALCQKRVRVDEEIEGRDLAVPGPRLRLGDVTVETRVTGFKKVRFHSIENVGYGEVDLPPLVLETVSCFLDLDRASVDAAMKYGADFFQSGLHGAARVLSSLLPFFVMGDPGDIDYFIDGSRIYIYDLYPGGIGYAEKAFELFEKILAAAREHVAACGCPAGCPSCVLPASTRYEIAMEPSILEYPFPKEAARFLLHRLSGAEPYAPRFEPVEVPKPPRAMEPRPALDPRTARKVKRAMGGFPGDPGAAGRPELS